MEKIFYIDATMREGSRTRRIASALIEELGKRYEIETVRLDGADFPAVNGRILQDNVRGIIIVFQSAPCPAQRRKSLSDCLID